MNTKLPYRIFCNARPAFLIPARSTALGIFLSGSATKKNKHKQTHAMKLLEKPQIQDHLETLADKHSLCFILNCLAQISFEKSDHVQATWQDRALAKQWEKIAVSLEAIADKNDNL